MLDPSNNTSYGALTGKKGELYERASEPLNPKARKAKQRTTNWMNKVLILGIVAIIAIFAVAILVKNN